MHKYKKIRKSDARGRSFSTEAQYFALRHEMVRHPKFCNLSGNAIKVLLGLCSRHNGFNNGKISCSCEELKTSLKLGKTTVCRALAELEEAGFIVCVEKGYFTDRRASTWEITFLKDYGQTTPPPDLWKDPEQRPRAANFRSKRDGLLNDCVELIRFENKHRSSNGTDGP